jgi:hypothetical protein
MGKSQKRPTAQAQLAQAFPLRSSFTESNIMHTLALHESVLVEDASADCVAFALGFLHLGEKNGTIIPGQANVQLAQMLERCARWFNLVLTQKAISDALEDPRALRNGTPVLQMHRHDPRFPVRTLAALGCALGRFTEMPARIVLLAHPRHHRRALMDLQALYDGDIVVLYPGRVVYPEKHWSYPLRWMIKSLLAWPVDYFLIQCIKHPVLAFLWFILKNLGIHAACPAALWLPKITREDEEWRTRE